VYLQERRRWVMEFKGQSIAEKVGKNPSLCGKTLEYKDQDSAMAHASHEGRHTAPHGYWGGR
jgi:hypothetical protein